MALLFRYTLQDEIAIGILRSSSKDEPEQKTHHGNGNTIALPPRTHLDILQVQSASSHTLQSLNLAASSMSKTSSSFMSRVSADEEKQVFQMLKLLVTIRSKP